MDPATTNQRLSQRPRTIRQHLDDMSPWESSLALALLTINDAHHPLRQFLPMSQAREIVEGRAKWPSALLVWKAFQELRHFHGAGERPAPAWLDAPSRRPSLPSKAERFRDLRRQRGRA